ncbi:MAG: hypothetical protein QOD36_4742 [Mycobacterium sp.]|nr:hypothetical protein [Mycobacterium sp.]
MSPEEKAAADAEMHRRTGIAATQIEAAHAAQAASVAAQEQSRTEHQARLDAEVLGGAAGAAVHGTVPSGPQPGALDQMKHTAHALTNVSGLLGFGSGFAPGIRDPIERARVQAGERAARDAARGPYLAARPFPATITRVPCRGATQHHDVARFLADSGQAARPDLVFGVYRVPDRISPRTPGGEARRFVEWDVVHAPGVLPTAVALPNVARFDAGEHTVRRAHGQPSVLDEDLALAGLIEAGIPPEACLGVARDVVMEAGADLRDLGAGETGAVGVARVTGVAAFHTTSHVPPALVDVPFEGVAGTYVEVLNWAAVRRVVHPRPQKGPETPSPFPYLPSTPQEVLLAYLDVVGLQPGDCYGAEVTVDEMSGYGPVTSTTRESLNMDDLRLGGYEESVCADGKSRTRLQCGSRVVVSYRDRPKYAEGRKRWHAYQDNVLFARMHLKTGARRVIADEFEDVPGGAARRAVSRVAGALDKLTSFTSQPDHFRVNLRYCQPLER